MAATTRTTVESAFGPIELLHALGITSGLGEPLDETFSAGDAPHYLDEPSSPNVVFVAIVPDFNRSDDIPSLTRLGRAKLDTKKIRHTSPGSEGMGWSNKVTRVIGSIIEADGGDATDSVVVADVNFLRAGLPPTRKVIILTDRLSRWRDQLPSEMCRSLADLPNTTFVDISKLYRTSQPRAEASSAVTTLRGVCIALDMDTPNFGNENPGKKAKYMLQALWRIAIAEARRTPVRPTGSTTQRQRQAINASTPTPDRAQVSTQVRTTATTTTTAARAPAATQTPNLPITRALANTNINDVATAVRPSPPAATSTARPSTTTPAGGQPVSRTSTNINVNDVATDSRVNPQPAATAARLPTPPRTPSPPIPRTPANANTNRAANAGTVTPQPAAFAGAAAFAPRTAARQNNAADPPRITEAEIRTVNWSGTAVDNLPSRISSRVGKYTDVTTTLRTKFGIGADDTILRFELLVKRGIDSGRFSTRDRNSLLECINLRDFVSDWYSSIENIPNFPRDSEVAKKTKQHREFVKMLRRVYDYKRG